MTWHPYGDSLFLAYTADGGDNQVSIINLNVSKEKVTFLEKKPHTKGIVNSISFKPWEDLCFAIGGSDHAVIMWTEKEGGDYRGNVPSEGKGPNGLKPVAEDSDDDEETLQRNPDKDAAPEYKRLIKIRAGKQKGGS
ncbi:hypothetical protein SUGI_0624930 [Cryptomeria japonica]|nr:hypothetical protein SUGI_0624930 [Cryptomeria japonica]